MIRPIFDLIYGLAWIFGITIVHFAQAIANPWIVLLVVLAGYVVSRAFVK